MNSSLPAVDRRLLSGSGLQMEFFVVPWDSAIFGQTVVQLEGLQLTGSPTLAGEDFMRYEQWREVARPALEVAKLDARQLQELAFLEMRGFRWMELQYRMGWRAGVQMPEALDAGLRVAPMQSVDWATVEAIAASAFETSRFAMDASVGKNLAGRRYRAWLANALADDRQELLVAHEAGGRLVGFFLVERQGERVYWHLTAVDPSLHGRGYGQRLWRHMMAWHWEQGVRRVETSISAHNLPVLGLYGRIGFRFLSAQACLHRGGLDQAVSAF